VHVRVTVDTVALWHSWWTQWICDIHGGHSGSVTFMVDTVALWQVSPLVLPFPPLSVIPPIPHTHFQLHVAVTRRTNGRSLGTFQKTILFRKPDSPGQKINFTFESLREFFTFSLLCGSGHAVFPVKRELHQLSLYLLQMAAWPWHHSCVMNVTAHTAEGQPVRTNTWFVQTAEILGKIVRRWRDDALCRVCSNADMRLGSMHVW